MTTINEKMQAVLRDIHPDPFTQVALVRVYQNAPGLLDPEVVARLQQVDSE